MTLTTTGKVALESWPYNKQSLVWCCVCDCFKDNVHCLMEDYFSNSLLSLEPRTGLNTCFKSPVLQSATSYLEMKHESLWRIHFTQCQLSIFPIWNIYQCYLRDELKACLILFSQWPCNLGSCNLLKTWSISYSTIFLQCAKVYVYTVAGWMDGWMDAQTSVSNKD